MRKLTVLKAALKAMLPFQSRLRQLKRRITPYEDNSDNSMLALSEGLRQIRVLKESGADLSGDVLEFGCGWLPIIPLLFHIAGARRIHLTDVERLLDANTIEKAKRYVLQSAGVVADALGQEASAIKGRLIDFSPDYLVPWDSAAQPSRSVDIITSRAVFEHIPSNLLDAFLRDFRRILRPTGFMCHIVDNSDHGSTATRALAASTSSATTRTVGSGG